MSEEFALRRAMNTASRVKAILEDELVAGALDAIEAELRAEWESSQPDDSASRENAYRMLRAAKAFRQRFQKVIDDGAVARAVLDSNEAQQRRARETEHD
ncbi:MAG TPA: hypothetical protein VH184_05965 [Dongiaceae bacterium]|jgi:hypothetical protein|nr:hypothetical protein [Dongiaceae bacterium]